MKRLTYSSLLLLFALPALAPLFAADDDPDGIAFFEKKIRPVLVKHCYECHSAESKEVKGGLLLDTRDGIRQGGDSGHAVVPGDKEGSLILSAIRYEDYEMPPDEQLPAAVIADFERWIGVGAPDPRGGKSELIKQEINFEEGRRFWSFQPIASPAPPKVQDASWPAGDIDRFVLARLEQNELQPAAEAENQALIRRLYFDLIGLPPSPEELAHWSQRLGESQDKEAALAELVDSLLASPRFGERWGRHWLDIARFAESNGRERNFLYPHAWRYRDYVIAAFNEDKPFDRFITEQLAGDLLPAETPDERNRLLVATGFLAIGPKLLNERDREAFRMDMVDEQIDVTTRSFMALTASCGRCHDHKFDPVPTAEYYALAGIFRSTETLYGTSGQGNRQASKLMPLAGDEEQADTARKEQGKRLAKLETELQEAKGEVKGAGDAKARKKLQARVKQLNQQIQKLKNEGPAAGKVAMGVQEGSAGDCPIYVRGETSDPGEIVPRGFLTIATLGETPEIDEQSSGRLELAGWIASEVNPLTARVIANRVWHWMFGEGLVRTVDNFGANGEAPTHAELLDHLATTFAEDGWSIKRLVRRIALSRAYRMSSEFDGAAFEKDPENRLLWRMNSRRLDAESIRDAILFAGGRIELEPREGSLVADQPDNTAVGRGVSAGDFEVSDRHRSVYLPIVRNAVPESLAVFDFAEPSILIGDRDITTVPAQALYLMNSPFVIEQSEQMARRLLAAGEMEDAARVDLAYRIAFARGAEGDEIERALAFVENYRRTLADNAKDRDAIAWAGLCQALFASAEFRYLD